MLSFVTTVNACVCILRSIEVLAQLYTCVFTTFFCKHSSNVIIRSHCERYRIFLHVPCRLLNCHPWRAKKCWYTATLTWFTRFLSLTLMKGFITSSLCLYTHNYTMPKTSNGCCYFNNCTDTVLTCLLFSHIQISVILDTCIFIYIFWSFTSPIAWKCLTLLLYSHYISYGYEFIYWVSSKARNVYRLYDNSLITLLLIIRMCEKPACGFIVTDQPKSIHICKFITQQHRPWLPHTFTV